MRKCEIKDDPINLLIKKTKLGHKPIEVFAAVDSARRNGL